MATVHVPSDYPTIAAAMAHVGSGDTIALDPGYSNETATVTVEGLTVDGAASSLGIHLALGAGIIAVTLSGSAPISVSDNDQFNTLVGNSGANVITVTGGSILAVGTADVVDGSTGADRLIVDFSAAVSPVSNALLDPINPGIIDGYTGTYTDLLGGHTVTFNNVDTFDIRTGSGADSITTGGGNDTIEGGPGADALNGAVGFDFASYAHWA